jgi:hypothetical protein
MELRPFTTDLYVPRYRPLSSGAWELRIGGPALVPSYWGDAVLAMENAALLRGGETWMSITPMELESQEIGIHLARGHVLIFGLGMGWSAAASAMMPGVERVIVVERDPGVLALHRELRLFDQLPDAARAKVHVLEGDAFAYRPDTPVDLLMPDIWLPLVSDGRVEEVRRMQANVGARAIYFWGQELELARHAKAAGRELDDAGIAATVAEFGLPLIGPDLPDYSAKVAAASNRWIRGRWLRA